MATRDNNNVLLREPSGGAVSLIRQPVELVVDTVKEVADIAENQIELPPEVSRNSMQRYSKGLGEMSESIKILLDIEKLVRNNDMEALLSVA